MYASTSIAPLQQAPAKDGLLFEPWTPVLWQATPSGCCSCAYTSSVLSIAPSSVPVKVADVRHQWSHTLVPSSRLGRAACSSAAPKTSRRRPTGGGDGGGGDGGGDGGNSGGEGGSHGQNLTTPRLNASQEKSAGFGLYQQTPPRAEPASDHEKGPGAAHVCPKDSARFSTHVSVAAPAGRSSAHDRPTMLHAASQLCPAGAVSHDSPVSPQNTSTGVGGIGGPGGGGGQSAIVSLPRRQPAGP